MLRDEVKKFFDWFINWNIDIVNNAKKYTDYYDSKIEKDYTPEERKKRLKGIQQKIDHSNRVADGMELSCGLADLNEESKQEYLDLAWVIGILHDIARPLQMQETGTYVDNDSYKEYDDINSHDDAGSKLLFDYGFADELNLPDNLKYIIKECVRQHGKKEVTANLTRYSDEDISLLLKNKSLNQILNDNKLDEIEMLTYFYLRMLRDVDKIDIYRQVISGEIPIYREFIKYDVIDPKTNEKDTYNDIARTFNMNVNDIFEANDIDHNTDLSSVPEKDIILIPTALADSKTIYVPDDIYDSFTKNELPFYRELQKRRDYNFLSATVVRLNFLWSFNSLEALKMIRDEDLLMKMFNNYPIEYQEKMRYVFEAAKTILNNRINEMELKNTKKK